MNPDEVREFVASNHRAVLITRRSGGGLQTSPVLVGVDDEGRVVISTREGAYKTRNLRRDQTVVLCVRSDDFFGRWMKIEGTAQDTHDLELDLRSAGQREESLLFRAIRPEGGIHRIGNQARRGDVILFENDLPDVYA